MSPVADGEELARAAGAELLVFDRAKLLPHVERADAFLDYVLEGELPADHSVIREYDPSDPDSSDVEAEAAGSETQDANAD